MKKIKPILLILILALIAGLFAQKALAAGVTVQGICYGNGGTHIGYNRLWSDKGIITADGQDVLTIYADNLMNQTDKCPTAPCFWTNNQKYRVSITGSGNSYYPAEFIITNQNPQAVFKITSTVAEEKIITIQEYTSGSWLSQGYSNNCQWIGIKVKFTVPVQTATAPTTTTPVPTPTPTAQPTPPAIPTLKGFKLGDSEFPLDQLSTFHFTTTSRIAFVGTSVPNGKITLYISELITAQAPVDENGNWSYFFKQPFHTGKHSIQITATDPQTGLTSEKSNPNTFTVLQTPLTESFRLTNFEYILSSLNRKEFLFYDLAIAVLITLVGLAIAEGIIMIADFPKKRRKRLSQPPDLRKPRIPQTYNRP